MAEYWIRRAAGTAFVIEDLGVEIPAGPVDYDLRREAGVPFDEINGSEDLQAAFDSGDLIRLDGDGGSVIPPEEATNDAIQPHGLSHTVGALDALDVGGLSGELADPQTPKTHGHSAGEVSDIQAAISGNTDVSQNSSHRDQTGNAHSNSTDTIPEGAVNRYFTDARVNTNANVSANTTHRASTDNPHDVTAQQSGAIPTSDKGVAGGVCSLDSSSLVPLTNLPDSVKSGLSYQGTWNANTNTPTLTSGSGTSGHFYIVSIAGSTNLDGITDWSNGDWAVFDGDHWQKIDNSDRVSSVNGKTGSVVLNTDDVDEGSTNQYYTEGRVEAIALKRAAGDFNSFTSKTSPIAADILLGEDSENGFAKVKIPISSLTEMSSESEWFSGYDSIGLTSVSTSWVDIPLNSEHVKDTGFTHTGSSAEVEVGEDFTYLIAGRVSLGGVTNRTSSETRLVRDTGSGYVEVPGTRCYGYHRNAASDEDTASFDLALPMNAGDKIKLQSRRIAGENLTTMANGSGLVIGRVKGKQGDPGPAGSNGEITIKDEGSTVSGGPFDALNFVGANVEVTDAGEGQADVTVSNLPPTPVHGESDGTTSGTSSSWTQKLRVSASTAVGTYKLEWYAEGQSTDDESSIGMRIQQDDTTTHGEVEHAPGMQRWGTVGEGFQSFSGFKVLSLTAGNYDFDIDYQSNGGGSVQIRRCRIVLTRVA